MRPQHLLAENFRSVVKADLALPAKGLHLVRGRNFTAAGASSNGAGKSSLCEMIYWVLYGKPMREKAVPQSVVRHGSKGGALTSFTFERDGHTYTVTRTRKGSTTTLSLTRDGQDISSHDKAQTQELIDQAIGLSADDFIVTSYFADDAQFASLTDKGRKQLIERLLGLGDLEAALKAVRDDLKQVRAQKLDAAHAVEQAEAIRAERERTLQELQGEQAKLNQEHADEVLGIQQALGQAQAAHASAVAGQGTAPEQIQGQLEQAQGLLQQLQPALNNAMAKLADSKREAQHAAQRGVEVAEVSGTVCPTCEQQVHEHKAHEIIRQHAERRAEYENRIPGEEAEVARLQAGVQQAEQLIHQLRQAHQAAVSKAQAVASLANDVSRLQEKLAEAQGRQAKQAGHTAEKEAKLRASVVDAEMGAQGHKLTASQLGAQIREMEYVESMFGLTGLRAMILDEVMPSLNTELNQLLADLTDGAVQVHVQAMAPKSDGTLSDKIGITVSVDGGGTDYTELSKGERVRVDIPVMLALRELTVARRGVNSGILILDEVLDGLDSTGVERVIPILERMAEDMLILVVSHMPEIAGIDDVITATKINGETVIEMGEGAQIATVADVVVQTAEVHVPPPPRGLLFGKETPCT